MGGPINEGQEEVESALSSHLPSTLHNDSALFLNKVAAATVAVQHSSAAATNNYMSTSGAGSIPIKAGQSAAGPGELDNVEVFCSTALSAPTLDALINTEIHTPPADGSGGVGAGGGGGKKKGFFTKKRFFVGTEKSSTGKNNCSANAGGGRQHDDNGFSALSAANAKGREPSQKQASGDSRKQQQSSASCADLAGAVSAVTDDSSIQSASNNAGVVPTASSSRKSRDGGGDKDKARRGYFTTVSTAAVEAVPGSDVNSSDGLKKGRNEGVASTKGLQKSYLSGRGGSGSSSANPQDRSREWARLGGS